MASVFRRGMERGDTEEEVLADRGSAGGMQPHTEAGREDKDTLLEIWKEFCPADIVILDFSPPELWKNLYL